MQIGTGGSDPVSVPVTLPAMVPLPPFFFETREIGFERSFGLPTNLTPTTGIQLQIKNLAADFFVEMNGVNLSNISLNPKEFLSSIVQLLDRRNVLSLGSKNCTLPLQPFESVKLLIIENDSSD